MIQSRGDRIQETVTAPGQPRVITPSFTDLPLPGYENLHPLGRPLGPRLVFALVKTRANAEDGDGNEVVAAVSTPGR